MKRAVRGSVVRGDRSLAPRSRATCIRCGRVREVKEKRPSKLCGDCRLVDPNFGREGDA